MWTGVASKALSGVLLEGREVGPVGFRLEADEQWDKLVVGHGWRALVHPGLLPVVPPTQAKGAFGWYKEWLSNQRQYLGTCWK